MKNFNPIFILALLMLFTTFMSAQTTWTGSKIIFSKGESADWTLEENQDRITNNVWLTRADNGGIFNIAQESSFQGGSGSGPSPIDTEWAFGSISDGVQNLSFTTWGLAHSGGGPGNPPSLVGQDMVLHLISDDIYIDLKFLSWGAGGANGAGGSFSYERSTNNLSSDQFQSKANLKIYPNPGTDVVTIDGLDRSIRYELFNILGRVVMSGSVTNNQKLDVSNLSTGAYFFKLENGATLKFIKK